MQETLHAFERTRGVVETITQRQGSKSFNLANALRDGKQILVCTIQTFPFALEEVRKLAATEGKRFAVIADEAHSSQSGDAADKLKSVLSHAKLELDEEGEISYEDLLIATMERRVDNRSISFVAFTATPKSKTLELFGRRPDRSREPAPDNKPLPYHVYSMRQAIEEGFILDVLQNYTPYQLAFKLAQQGQAELIKGESVEGQAARKAILGWVRLHAYNIAQKVQIVVEHFRACVQPLLQGRGKAMVVLASRIEAVRWKLAIEQYILEHGYQIGTLVAFSGQIPDSDQPYKLYSETDGKLNPNLRGREIRRAFEGDEYQILLVANKFQTGFDQPLLCGMYIDKRLAGIQAVQTLSRLNRAYPGKDTTYILDFANQGDEILEAFKDYYGTAILKSTTDPYILLSLRAELDATGHYEEREVERLVKVVLRTDGSKGTQSELIAAIEPVSDRLLRAYRGQQEQLRAARRAGESEREKQAELELESLRLFKRKLQTYLGLYRFLAQIFDYGNSSQESRYLFFRHLLPLLEFGREREQPDLSKLVLTHYQLQSKGKKAMTLAGSSSEGLNPIREAGTGGVHEKERLLLAELIEKLNALFQGELTEQDKVHFVRYIIPGKLMESKVLRQQATSNSAEQFKDSPDLKEELVHAVNGAMGVSSSMGTQILNSEVIQAGVLDVLLRYVGLYEKLRAEAQERGEAPRYNLMRRPPQSARWREVVPLVDLEVAAGAFSESQDAGLAMLEEAETWVAVTGHRCTRGWFAAWIKGHSMEPQVRDGSLALFAPVGGGSKEGKVVLAALQDETDSEHGGRYTLKTYRSKKSEDAQGNRQNTEIMLTPRNKNFATLHFTEENSEGLKILAEYKDTL